MLYAYVETISHSPVFFIPFSETFLVKINVCNIVIHLVGFWFGTRLMRKNNGKILQEAMPLKSGWTLLYSIDYKMCMAPL